MTAALEDGEWSAARPGCTLSPGKTRYPLYRRLGGHQDRSGRAENLVHTNRLLSQKLLHCYITVVLCNDMVFRFRCACYDGVSAERSVYKDHKLCVHADHKLHVEFLS